uniref:Cytochrome P450 n=1 Tax=Oryza punctata TaxID=4537 RepID=A0A0E0LQE3_ORYPU
MVVQLMFFFHDKFMAPMAEESLPLGLIMILLFLLLLLVLHYYLSAATRRSSAASKSNDLLPPSPPRLPVIGHMHLVGSNPHVSLADLADKHAADGFMLLQLGQVRNLVVSSPRAAEAILRTHDHVFASRPRSAIADILAYGSSNIAFSPYGDYWRKARKLVATHLLSPKKVQSLHRGREEEVGLVVAKLDQAAAEGAAVDMRELLGSFTNDVLCRAVSGKSFRREGRNKLFMELAAGNADQYAGFNLEEYFPSLAKVDLVRRVVSADTKKLKEKWDSVLGEIVNEHANKLSLRRDQVQTDDDEEQESDFVDILLDRQQEYNLTRDNIHAILMDMFAAGTDTSYIALEFAMAELIRKPHLLTKLQDEVRNNTTEMVSEDELNNMPYLKAVVKETLRLHPPVPLLLPRLSMDQCNANGYTIPANTRVIINVWALGRDAKYWENPQEFMPERFMNSGDATNNVDFKGTDFQFLPFGAGRRICPGMNFGMASVELMLANLMYCFDWELPVGMDKDDVDMTDVFALTMARKEKLYLIPRSHPWLKCYCQFTTTMSMHQPTMALLLALLCPLLLLLIKRCRAKSRDQELLDKLPSPPGRLPVIGHLHLIGSLPYVSFRDLAVKHGPDLMLLHLGTVPTLVVSSARAAQAILRTHDQVFASRTYSAVTDILFYGSSDVAFSPYGEYWRQVKKIATTHLLTTKKVRSYGDARQQEVRLVMARINDAVVARTTVDLSELLNCFTNDVVCHAVSGKFFREEGRNQMFRELIEANSLLLGGFNLEDYFPNLARVAAVRRLLCAKAHDVNKRWDQLLDKLIDDHATKRSSSVLDQDDEESDFIDVLLSIQHEYGLTRDNVKAILVIMFEGGTDTSYIELEYAMAELMRKPQLMAKLQAEVRSVVPRGQEIVTEEQLSRMPYLKAVIKETLRLHLAGPLLVPHLSIAECDIEGYTIPSGTRVFVNAWALSRDPNFWENAQEFVPERFLNSTAPDYNGNNFHFLPFGSGRRICPGINFAIATIEIMLANLVYRFDWEIPAKGGIDMTEAFGLTVHRKEKLLLVASSSQLALSWKATDT